MYIKIPADSAWLHDWHPTQEPTTCGHGWFYLDSECQYEREKLEGVQDFNLTFENINNGQERQLIVTKRVVDFFRKNRIRARYEPVTIL